MTDMVDFFEIYGIDPEIVGRMRALNGNKTKSPSVTTPVVKSIWPAEPAKPAEQAKPAEPAKPAERVQPAQQSECCVCLDEKPSVAFVPCGHVCTCKNCSVTLNLCPLCKVAIVSILPIYLS